MLNTGPYAAVASAFLLEFEFASSVRPVDVGGSTTDTRSLSVGFCAIRVSCRATGAELANFDFKGTLPDGVTPIYGAGVVEAWGFWNTGPRTALLLDVPGEAPAGYRIELDYNVLAEIPVVVSCGWTYRGQFTFTGTPVAFETEPMHAAAVCRADTPGGDTTAGVRPEISVIVLNYNRRDLSIACCTFLLRNPPIQPFEILLVDNGSRPELCTQLQQLGDPVRLICLDEARPYGEANALAAEAARGDTLVFLNNDAFVLPGALEGLYAALHADQAVGLTGPVFAFPNGRTQEVGGYVNVDLTTTRKGWGSTILQAEHLPQRSIVDYISGACMMLRRDDFLSLGGFDPLLDPMYYEDADLCLRLTVLGKRIELVGQSVVLHLLNATSTSEGTFAATEQAVSRNRETMTSRWADWLSDRRPEHAPDVDTVDAGHVKRLMLGFAGVPVTRMLTAGPLDAGAASRGVVATAAALSRLGPTVVSSPTQCSLSRLLSVCMRFGLQFDALTAAPAEMSLVGDADTLVHQTISLLPEPVPGGRRRLLYWLGAGRPDDAMPEPDRRRRVRELRSYDAIIVESDMAKRACLRRLSHLGAPFVRVEVVRPPAELFNAETIRPKQDAILVIAPFRPDPSANTQELILTAFRRLQHQTPGSRTRLILAGDIGPDYDTDDLTAYRLAAGDLPVEFIVNPSRSQMRQAMLLAKLCVSADGFGTRAGEGPGQNSGTDALIASAVSAGCVPIVYGNSTAAEVCELLGTGFRFHSAEELDEALSLAMGDAGSDGLPAATRLRAAAFSHEAYLETWKALLSDRAPGDGVANGVGQGHARVPSRLSIGAPAFPDARAERQALVVAGMHRSGTSAMARALSLAGAALPRDLMPGAPDNPSGFWESLGVVALNDRVLRELGSCWDDVLGFQARPALARARPEMVRNIRAVVRSTYRDESLIVLKDPRISLLVPLWEAALLDEGYTPVYVIMVRDPRQVAASLLRRNGFPRSKGLLLWASHMVAVERDTRGSRRRFVPYDDLLASAETELAKVEETMDGRALQITRLSSLELERFVDPSMRHASDERPLGPFERLLPLYDALLRNPCDEAAIAEAARDVERWLSELESIFGATLAEARTKRMDTSPGAGDA